MKQLITNLFTWAVIAGTAAISQDIIHYWHFNELKGVAVEGGSGFEKIPSDYSVNDLSGEMNYAGTGDGYVDYRTYRLADPVSNLNLLQGQAEDQGAVLRLRNPSNTRELIIQAPSTGFEKIFVDFAAARTGSGATEQAFYYSINDGMDWVKVGDNYIINELIIVEGVVVSDWELKTFDLSAIEGLNDNAEVWFKITFEGDNSDATNGNNRIDNFSIKGDALSATLNVIQSLVSFTQTIGTPSSVQSIKVAGSNLSENITLNAPTNYEISVAETDGFNSTLELNQVDGIVAETEVFIRLNSVELGSFNETLIIESNGAPTVEVQLNGETIEVDDKALLYYWHFNDWTATTDITVIDADFSLISGVTGRFEYTDPIEGERDIDRYSPGSTLNIQMDVTPGIAARVRNPAATRSLVFDVPTTGAGEIMFTYAIQRSGNGSQTNTVEYSLDGGNTFLSTGMVDNTQPVDGTEVWQILSYDLSAITGADDNPNFKIRILFEDINAANPSGNNRFDNITITGIALVDDLSLNELTKTTINLYPNPAEANVTISAQETIEHVYIFNSIGALVQSIAEVGSNEVSVDANELSTGMYNVLVQTTSGYSQVRFVKK